MANALAAIGVVREPDGLYAAATPPPAVAARLHGGIGIRRSRKE
jgi:hypothetical protein